MKIDNIKNMVIQMLLYIDTITVIGYDSTVSYGIKKQVLNNAILYTGYEELDGLQSSVLIDFGEIVNIVIKETAINLYSKDGKVWSVIQAAY